MASQHNEAFLKLVDDAKENIRECTVDDVLEKLGENEAFHFVDVREDEEWKAGRARGAKHLGRGVIERDIETEIPDREAQIILYCGGGFRSALAAESLQKMGYRNVISMDGGIRAWRERGLPEERG
jgi:rhodanese-related sulfurtransferase